MFKCENCGQEYQAKHTYCPDCWTHKSIAVIKNKYGYTISNFTKFNLPVKLNNKTGKLEIISSNILRKEG